MRAFWNGKKLVSKQGKDILAPLSFTCGLPDDVPLDGELWIGRQKLNQLAGILQSIPKEDVWKDVKYMLFDLPGSEEPLETRMRELQALRLPSHVQIVERAKCQNMSQFARYMKSITALGGVGIVAHEAGSLYTPGRTESLLTVKVNRISKPTQAAIRGVGREGASSLIDWVELPSVISVPYCVTTAGSMERSAWCLASSRPSRIPLRLALSLP